MLGVALLLEHVSHSYERGVRVLDDVGLSFDRGGWTAVMGPSGSGKSTLLYCASGLVRPSAGRVVVAGRDLSGLDEGALTRLRRDHVGFVFQGYNLLPALTCAQNVMLPSFFGAASLDRRRALDALADVGLEGFADAYPPDMSGGQCQRVAIARALATRPEIVFADEPTGALDTRTAGEVLDLFSLAASRGQTVVMVTHDPNVAAHAGRTVFLVDGRVRSIDAGLSAGELAAKISGLDRMASGARS